MNKTNTNKKKIDKPRLLSVVAILIFVIPALVLTKYAGEPGIYIGATLFMGLGGFAIWETLVAIGFNKYISVISALMIIPFFLVSYDSFEWVVHTGSTNASKDFHGHALNEVIDWRSMLVILIASVIPVLLEPDVAKEKLGYITTQVVVTFIMVVAAIFFKGLWAMNAMSINPVLYFLLIAIIGDTLGYIGGKYLGSKIFKGAKLAPKISPKKTWAGALMGFVFAFTFAVLFGYYMNIWVEINANQLMMSFVMALVLCLISPIGDLMFSLIKRKLDIKDFSNLLPGHGGIFDRVDAMSIVTVVGIMVYLIAI